MAMKITISLFCLGVSLALTGCSVEQNYRGVPSTQWQHLSAEQKQLIVDQSFQSEMKKMESDPDLQNKKWRH